MEIVAHSCQLNTIHIAWHCFSTESCNYLLDPINEYSVHSIKLCAELSLHLIFGQENEIINFHSFSKFQNLAYHLKYSNIHLIYLLYSVEVDWTRLAIDRDHPAEVDGKSTSFHIFSRFTLVYHKINCLTFTVVHASLTVNWHCLAVHYMKLSAKKMQSLPGVT